MPDTLTDFYKSVRNYMNNTVGLSEDVILLEVPKDVREKFELILRQGTTAVQEEVV